MDYDDSSRWIVGETLDTLIDETRTFVVHNRFPRWIGAIIVEHNSVRLQIQWCECQLEESHREQLTNEAIDFLSTFGIHSSYIMHGGAFCAGSIAPTNA